MRLLKPRMRKLDADVPLALALIALRKAGCLEAVYCDRGRFRVKFPGADEPQTISREQGWQMVRKWS